jgi:7-carboxy-7-deazaguanine synthase
MKIIVAEVFYSLQCEGRAIGTPAVFLRLGGCNLMCNSEHWRCDTIEVWQKGRSKVFEDIFTSEHISYLRKGAHLVITGGEPLLQQFQIVNLIEWLYYKHNLEGIFVEIETNGTIIPLSGLSARVKWWNVSPKLANCGEPYEKRVNDTALYELSRKDSIFKFVIKNEGDVQEILQDFGMLNFSDIVLMPAGATREELNITRPLVVELCKSLCLRYSERLHIVIWDKKTGV